MPHSQSPQPLSPSTLPPLIKEVCSARLYRFLVAVVVIYAGAVYLTGQSVGAGDRIMLFHYAGLAIKIAEIFLTGYLIIKAVYILIVERPAEPAKAIWNDYKATIFCPRNILHALPVILLFPIFFSAFTSFKSLIPEIIPFSYDPLFVKLDQAIHGGYHPWQVLMPLLGFTVITFAVASVYKLWFFAKFAFLYWQAFALSKPALRAQSLLTIILSWIINGSVFALLFSSAGPCYFGELFPEMTNPYQELMIYLQETSETMTVWALNSQDYLWQNYLNHSTADLSGISAFPSMHVSMAFIFLLTASHYNRIVFAGFFVFFAFIMVGSVFLGWHYAVDGYFAILTTWAIWIFSGRLIKRFNLSK